MAKWAVFKRDVAYVYFIIITKTTINARYLVFLDVFYALLIIYIVTIV